MGGHLIKLTPPTTSVSAELLGGPLGSSCMLSMVYREGLLRSWSS
eukprot:Gb_22759 [translate_table: standard]